MAEPSLEEVAANIAAIRARIIDALGDDAEAIGILDRVFPADWADAQAAVVWMLGNAARLATAEDGGDAAQSWLNRLVDEDGQPLDDKLRTIPEHVAQENSLATNGQLSYIEHDDDRVTMVIVVSRRAADQLERDQLRTLLTDNAETYIEHQLDHLYETRPTRIELTPPITDALENRRELPKPDGGRMHG